MAVPDNLFNIDMKRLALLAMPTWLRGPVAAAIVFAGMIPLCRMLLDLREFRRQTAYRVGHNGQVCRMRGALNDAFDPLRRRIRVEDAPVCPPPVIHRRDTGIWKPVPLRGASGVLTIYRRGFGGAGGFDFLVSVPAELSADDSADRRIRALVGSYKLAGKRFDIAYKQP
jgi:hypothetical protein